MEMSIALTAWLTAAYQAGWLDAHWAIAEAQMVADETWIHIDRAAWHRGQRAARRAWEARVEASGVPQWKGVENMTTRERKEAYRALLDSWTTTE
jgi:hypothetical protein